MDDVLLRRKWTLRAHGSQVVVVKRANEKTSHVLMKVFLWALYLPEYPQSQVEVHIGNRYKPDVVALDAQGAPLFWGEAGQVGAEKLATLMRRFPHTHFAFAKWDQRLEPLAAQLAPLLERRRAPVDIFSFAPDSAERFIGPDGMLSLTHADVLWQRLPADHDAAR